MYSFNINNTKIKNIELSVDTNITNGRFQASDNYACYCFKPYLKYIEFIDGNYIEKPNIEILTFYHEKDCYTLYYAKILQTHYEQGKNIPFYIENSISPAIYNVEKLIVKSNQYMLCFYIEDKLTYAKYKLKYM